VLWSPCGHNDCDHKRSVVGPSLGFLSTFSATVNRVLHMITYRESKIHNALADGYHRGYEVFGEESI
jgi:hypothetical protein